MARARYHHGDLRQQTRHEALKLLREKGDAAVTLRALAKTLGVSSPALYRHFRDRQALLADLAAQGFRELTRKLQQTPRDDPRDALTGLGLAYVEFAEANPRLYRLMFGGAIIKRGEFPELDQAGKQAFAVLQDTAEWARKAGYLTDKSLTTLTAAAWSLVHGLAQLTIDHHLRAGKSDPQLTHDIIALLMNTALNDRAPDG